MDAQYHACKIAALVLFRELDKMEYLKAICFASSSFAL
jgi:hypothetical protein